MAQVHSSVLLVGLHYAPEVSGNAPYTAALASGLRDRGLRVRVITGFPHYPEWRLRSGYHGWSMRDDVDGIRVLRLRHHVPPVPRTLARLHMELSFGLRALFAPWGRPDVVLTVSPALFSTALVVLRARLARLPVGVWVQDLYSRGVAETGASSVVVAAMKVVERAVFRSATEVSVIHERFRRYVVDDLGVPAERVRVIRNWTTRAPTAEVDRAAVREQLGLPADRVIALHAGNMGVKQYLENVVDAAAEADRTAARVHFVLLGHGNQRAGLERRARGVRSISFLDPLPDPEYLAVLRSADVLVVNDLPGVKEMSVPSKLTSYFAAGVPVVAATEPDSATAEEIRAAGAGVVVPPGDPARLLHAVENVAANREAWDALAAGGPEYVAAVLGASTAIDSYAGWLRSLHGRRTSPSMRRGAR